jgi:hypothetical protein
VVSKVFLLFYGILREPSGCWSLSFSIKIGNRNDTRENESEDDYQPVVMGMRDGKVDLRWSLELHRENRSRGYGSGYEIEIEIHFDDWKDVAV